MSSRTLATLSCFLVACSSSSGGNLTRVSEVTSSQKCPNGGVVIATGPDSNTNGKLDDSEVSSTTELCGGSAGAVGPDGPNGPNGPNGDAGTNGITTLINSTNLAAGNSNCVQGGVKVDIGLDDGAGGGTARNGTLEPGEVLNTRYICNGGMPYYPGSTTSPASPVGAFTINTSGGAGLNNNGGTGGSIEVRMEAGSLGGHAKIFKTGVADASFTVPAIPTFVAGAQPLVVNADLAINGYPDRAAGLGSADPVFFVTDEDLLFANVAGVATPITSIDVAAGKTLTLPHDGSGAFVYVTRDIRNAGTITTALLSDGVSRANLKLYGSSYYGLPGSSVRTTGSNATGTIGGNGGFLNIEAGGKFINQGDINCAGGSGSPGGSAGYVQLLSSWGDVFNTGAVTATGGTSATGVGGSGGQVSLYTYARGVKNSGAINSSGADGVTQGGVAGSISLDGYSLSTVRNTANLTARGGTCTAGNCIGARGGDVALSAWGGDARSSGTIDSRGGDGLGTGNGGRGGDITIQARDDSEEDALPFPTGSVQVSGGLDSRGGTGSQGGGGGAVTIKCAPASVPQGQEVTLFGYTDLTTSGGPSNNNGGGNAGDVNVRNSVSYWNGVEGPGGGAINEANIVGRGGDGSYAGNGATVSVETETGRNWGQPNELAINRGNVDVHGGAAGNDNGGGGGSVYVTGMGSATNTGTVNTTGGNSGEATEDGGGGGECVILAALGLASNTGAITSNGGTGNGFGGHGGYVQVHGKTASNTAALSANGGAGGNRGGGGGFISILSQPGNTSTSTGTYSVTGGSGGTGVSQGTVLVDSVDVTP